MTLKVVSEKPTLEKQVAYTMVETESGEITALALRFRSSWSLQRWAAYLYNKAREERRHGE